MSDFKLYMSALQDCFTGLANNEFIHWLHNNFFSGNTVEWVATAGVSFALITAAEIGDKSQIVCMTLAARYRAGPIICGAVSAFGLLNLMAVLFGTAIATWVPEKILVICVALLFAGFGLHALRMKEEDAEEEIAEKSGHGIFMTTFLLITMAEFGDKTQIAVAGLSSAAIPASVWVGATLALAMTSAIGVWAGRSILQKIPMIQLHRISGIIFLLLATLAIMRIWPIIELGKRINL